MPQKFNQVRRQFDDAGNPVLAVHDPWRNAVDPERSGIDAHMAEALDGDTSAAHDVGSRAVAQSATKPGDLMPKDFDWAKAPLAGDTTMATYCHDTGTWG